jgi:hypothetical protein
MAILVIFLDAVATALLARSALFSARQKALRFIFVWIAPLIGAIIVMIAVRSAQAKSDRLDQLRILREIWRSATQDEQDPDGPARIGPKSPRFD